MLPLQAPFADMPTVIQTPLDLPKYIIVNIWTRNRLVLLMGASASSARSIYLWNQCSGCTNGRITTPEGGCECPSGTYWDTNTCRQCKNEQTCDPGHYKTGLLCAAGNLTSDISCASCKLSSYCREGQKLTGYCDGTTTSDVTACEDCLQCGTDQFLTGACTGQVQTAECVDCRTSCPAGNYITPGSCSKYEDTLCTSCLSRCPAGHFISGLPCDGTQTSDSTSCTNCSQLSCPHGTWLDMDFCSTGATVGNQSCKPCTRCGDDEYLSLPCTTETKGGQCAKCSTYECDGGFWRSKNCTADADIVCIRCDTTCPAGFHIKHQCTPRSNIECEVSLRVCVRVF